MPGVLPSGVSALPSGQSCLVPPPNFPYGETGGSMDNKPLSAAGNIHWHVAFYQAIQAELIGYQNVLDFKYEYQLTAEPLRIDTLVILKSPEVRIEKNIGQIFRRINICEYKSPEDHLSVKDFYKVYAYGLLFAALSPDVNLEDLSLTFVGDKYPKYFWRQ
jgi:hypothetical protein